MRQLNKLKAPDLTGLEYIECTRTNGNFAYVIIMLTIEEEHLLKRELLRLEMNHESEGLDNMVNLDQLGTPFALPNGQFADGSDYPLCSYVLRNYVVSFPLIKNAKPKFWTETTQPFIQGIASKEISSSADRDETTKRRRMGKVIKRMLLLFFVAGLGSNRKKIKNTEVSDSVEGLNLNEDETSAKSVQSTDSKNSKTSEKSEATDSISTPEVAPSSFNGTFATVLGCREITSSGIMKKTHSEYILECFHDRQSRPVYVARSWQDFVTLSKQLSQSLPGKRLPSLPLKTLKNTVLVINDKEEVVLLREPQRVLLRQYLKQLCFIPRAAQSSIFQTFLFKNPIVLSPVECNDIENRLALDKTRYLSEQEFLTLTLERERKLGKYIAEIKNQILLEDALPKLFMEMKMHQRVEDMSPLLQKFVEWCLVQLAGVLFNLFIAKDTSPELFSQVKRLHNLLPYTAMRGILKLSNPAIIFKKMTDLFMATPFGSKSLLQQMFIKLLNDDMKSQEVLIAELEQQIPEKDIIKAIELYIESDYYTRNALQQLAMDEKVDLIVEIVRTHAKSRNREVMNWYKEWNKTVHSENEDLGNKHADKYSQLKDLLKLKVRAHDKQVMQDFWAEAETMKFIREIVNLTYDVLIDIFKYANISESLGDFQKFMNDFISYVSYATSEVVLNSRQMVNDLLGVLKKHQNSIFKFINKVYARDEGFFIDLVQWMALFVEFIKRGKCDQNKLDLLGLVENSKSADPVIVKKELAELQAWLDKRRKTASESTAGLKTTDDFPVTSQFELSDLGLTAEDVDFGVAEVENENFEEFVLDPSQEVNDPVLLERLRIQKQKDIEARKAQLQPRPLMKETAKLLPAFKTMVFEVLGEAKLDPVKFINV